MQVSFLKSGTRFVDRLDKQGRLDRDEVFIDRSFAPAKKSLARFENQAR
jgi:hypothetical protein